MIVVLFRENLHRFPGNFEITTLVNNSMPLVFAAIGQSIVVLTRGIDLSVGGMMDLTNAVAATHMRELVQEHDVAALVIPRESIGRHQQHLSGDTARHRDARPRAAVDPGFAPASLVPSDGRRTNGLGRRVAW